MKAREVKYLQQLVEGYWQLYLEKDPHGEPPGFLVEVIDYLERNHRLLFNTVTFRWHET